MVRTLIVFAIAFLLIFFTASPFVRTCALVGGLAYTLNALIDLVAFLIGQARKE